MTTFIDRITDYILLNWRRPELSWTSLIFITMLGILIVALGIMIAIYFLIDFISQKINEKIR